MAITFYTGDPRAGKSYGVTEHVILQALKEGRQLVTNIPLYKGKLCAHAEEQGWDFPRIYEISIEEIEKNPSVLLTFPSGSVFALDEVWELWPSGQRTNQVHKSYLQFFKMHGHRVGETGHTDQIILISQNPSDLAMWLKNMVTETYWITKLDKVGKPNSYRVDIWSSCPGARGKQPKLIRQLFGSYKPSVYQFYKSQTQNNTHNWGHGLETKVDGRANILKSAQLRYGIPAALILFLFGGYGLYSSWGLFDSSEEPLQNIKAKPKPTPVLLQANHVHIPDDMQIKNKPSIKSEINDSQNIIASTPSQSQQPLSSSLSFKPSREWRLAAVIESEEGGRVLVQGRAGLREIPYSDCYTNEGTMEIRCMVDGAIVASWTGQRMSNFGNTAVEGDYLP